MGRINYKRVEYFIIKRCVNRCVFCSESWRFNGRHESFDAIKKTLLKEKKRGVRLVHFMGGEPTLHPQIVEISRWATEQGFSTYMMTNGIPLADQTLARRLLPWVREICISLHGHNRKIHDGLTGHPGSFDALQTALDHMMRFHPENLSADTTLTRQNIGSLKGIADLLARRKIFTWSLITVIPSGQGKNNFNRIIPRLNQARKMIPDFLRHAVSLGHFPMIAGLPLCVFGQKYTRHSLDFKSDVFIKGAPLKHKDTLKLWAEPGSVDQRIDMGRIKPVACAPCALKRDCGGVFELYHKFYGDAELTPFKK